MNQFCLIVLVVLVGQRIANCQEPNIPNFNRQEVRTSFVLGLTGDLKKIGMVVSTSTPKRLPIFDMLDHQTTRSELDLSDSQAASISKRIKAADNVLKEITEITTKRKLKLDELEGSNKKLNSIAQQLRDSLGPKQKTRLRQIALRMVLRERGPTMSILDGAIGKKLRIAPSTGAKVYRSGLEFSKTVRKKSRELKAGVLQDLIGVLSSDKKKIVNEFISEDYSKPSSLSMGVVIWQLSYQQGGGSKKLSVAETDVTDLVVSPIFEMSVAGTLEAKKNNRRSAPMEFQLVKLLIQPETKRALGVLPYQAKVFEESLSRFRKRSNEIDFELQQAIERGGDLKQAGSIHRSNRKNALRNFEGLVEETLLPQQVDRLKLVVNKVSMVRSGLVASLVDGQLGQSINITKQEKKLILKRAKVIKNRLEKESLNFEAEVYRKVFGELNQQNQKQLMELIGPPLKAGYSDLDILAFQLSGK